MLLLLLVGCNGRATPTPFTPLQPTPTPAIEPLVDETVVLTANDQLVVWLPAFTGIATEGSSGTIFSNAFHQFEQRNPTIRLDIQVKAEMGAANLFNFLRSAQQVAPTILPDLVLINTQQLWQVVELGMVVALAEEEILPGANFFPVARDAVQYRTQTVGIPYIVDVTHLVYSSEVIDTPPRTWAELIANNQAFLYPATETGTTNATLLQYVGAGGELLEDGSISDPEVLEAFFTFLVQAHESGVIPNSVLDMSGFSSVWRAFSEDRTLLATVQVTQFHPNATGIKPPNYTFVPTRNGDPVTIADTWAFAILTEDAHRRQLALTLVQRAFGSRGARAVEPICCSLA